MANFENNLKDLKIELPETQSPIANYVPGVRTGNLLFLSGAGPLPDQNGELKLGKLGSDLSVEEGYNSARSTCINLLSRIKNEIGSIDNVVRIVKIFCMVNSTTDFTSQPLVANGCSDLLVEVFGDYGKHSRSAVGVAALPNNWPIEIEMIVEIK
jgi:enamine deaminase RidA (YjgF/YER057c/UK114 family)